jgi:hypothetical protein
MLWNVLFADDRNLCVLSKQSRIAEEYGEDKIFLEVVILFYGFSF